MKFGTLLAALILLSTFSQAQLSRQWVSRFNSGVKGSDNAATAMAIDDSGNVAITGYVNRKTSGYDIVTIDYNPNGSQRWIQYYTGSGNNADKGVAIAVDTGNNVYVVGTTTVGSSIEYVTIKYNYTNGAQAWAEVAGTGSSSVPVAIAVGDSLNVYVTGYSNGGGTGYDFLTIKYSPLGDTLWTRRYNGRLSLDDKPAAMALYSGHSLYITGTTTDTAVDYLTIKYDTPTGNLVWAQDYNGPASGNDYARAIVISGHTDVFVTGGSQGVGTGYDYATIDYDTSGAVQWVSRYDGGGDDQAYAIALSGTNRVYVTGKSVNVGTFNDIVTVKYGFSGGAQGWVSSFNGSANDDDTPVAIIGGNNPYVLGVTESENASQDYALIKYNGNNGSEQWHVLYDGPTHGNDLPAAMVLSGSSVYVTGKSAGLTGKGNDLLTIDYADPNHFFFRTFNQTDLNVKGNSLKSDTATVNAGNARDAAFAAAYPKKGPLFYVGNPRFDSANVFAWILVSKSASFTSMLPDTGQPRGLSGLVGQQKDPKNTKYNNRLVGDLMAMKININASDAEVTPPGFGDLIYNDGDTSNHYEGTSLRQLVSFASNVLTYWNRYTGVDYVKLDSMFIRANAAFSGPLRQVSAIPVVVTGAISIDSVTILGPGVAPVVLPEAFTPRGIIETPLAYRLNQNYPNPFNPTTMISFEIPKSGLVSVTVFDILGQKVATILNNQQMDAGRKSVWFDGSAVASGAYFYRLDINRGEFTSTKKMLLVK